jgi:glucose/mannose transport system substrate-binding protein
LRKIDLQILSHLYGLNWKFIEEFLTGLRYQAIHEETTMRVLKKTGLAVTMACLGFAQGAMAQTAEVIHWWTTGGESAAVQELAKAYTAAGGKWVDGAIADGGTARTAIINRIVGGKPPTVAQFNTSLQYHEMVLEGLLNNIDAVAKAGNWDKILPEPIKKFVKIDGKYFAMPVNIHNPSWFWYSKAVLAKAGVAGEPKSMDEFFAALDKIKASGAVPLALGGQAWQEGILFNAILHTSGGADLYKRFYGSADGSVAMSPEFKKVLSDFKRLKNYVDPGSPNRDWNVTTAMVITNKAGFQVMGDWAKGEFSVAKQTAGKDYGCFPGWGAKAPYMLEGDVFVFPKTKDPQAIKAQQLFATVAASPAVQVAFNAKKGSIPIRTDVEMGALDICSQQGVAALKDPSRHLPAPSQLAEPEKKGLLDDAITKFWNTNQSVDEAAKILADILKT